MWISLLILCRRIVYNDLSNIAPEHYTKHITTRLADFRAVETAADRSTAIQVLESVYRFTLGSVAGGKYSSLKNSKIRK